MHRAINIKHRIVRRVDIEIAPLATFDTIDLGDEDEPIKKSLSDEDEIHQESKVNLSNSHVDHVLAQCHTFYSGNVQAPEFVLANERVNQTRIIGGNTSKKSLTQAGGDKTQKETGGLPSGVPTSTAQDGGENTEVLPDQINLPASEQPSSSPRCESQTATPVLCETHARRVPYDRQGSLGRVSLPVRQPGSPSSSSSSSPESRSENTFTFQTLKAEGSHLQLSCTSEISEQEDKQDTLVPEIPKVTDPSQILSPSKRKAYERRIERLKVTTSPIARPRSTTPINVVTLDEYAAISSPDASPASPSVLQDKLKITLPADEFTAKPKTPKHYSGKRRSSEDTVFHFSEDTLFSRSKSALVVEGDGNLPLSPRRVLLPPTLTPTSSPKLSASPRLTKPVEADSIPPTISFAQQKATTHKFFGETVDEVEEENWADFSEPSPTIEAPLSALIPNLYSNNITSETSGDLQPPAHSDGQSHQNFPVNTTSKCNNQNERAIDTLSQPSTHLPETNQLPYFYQSEQYEIKQQQSENLTEIGSSENSCSLETAQTDIVPDENYPNEQLDIFLPQNQESPINSQADQGEPDLNVDNILQDQENCNLFANIETTASSDSKHNIPTSEAATGALVNLNNLLEGSHFESIVADGPENCVVNNSQRLPTDDASPSFQAALNEQLDGKSHTNPFATTSITHSFADVSLQEQPKSVSEDSNFTRTVLEESESEHTLLDGKATKDLQTNYSVFENNQVQHSEYQSLETKDSVWQSSQPQLIDLQESQSTTPLQEDILSQHSSLQDSYQQTTCAENASNDESSQILQPQQISPHIAHLEDRAPNSESMGAPQAVSPFLYQESSQHGLFLGSKDGRKSELDGSGDLLDNTSDEHGLIDLGPNVGDSNPFSSAADFSHPSPLSSFPSTSHPVQNSNPFLSNVDGSPDVSDKCEKTTDSVDCTVGIPVLISCDNPEETVESLDCVDVKEKLAA